MELYQPDDQYAARAPSTTMIYFRVFGTSEVTPPPADLLAHLRQLRPGASGHFTGDDLGWFRAELHYPSDDTSYVLERFLVAEEELRGELNTWAAWLESIEDSPHSSRLMQTVIASKQFFTLHADDADDFDVELCHALSQLLARATEGIYQVDGEGFHAADGTLLVEE